MKMSPRDKQVAAGGFLLLGALVFFRFVAAPMAKNIGDADRAVKEGKAAIEELRAQSGKYARLKHQLDVVHDKIAKREADTGAFSRLDAIAKECQLTQAPKMRQEVKTVAEVYSQTVVTITFEAMSLAQATDFLKKIQSADLPMGVRSLQLKISKSPGMLDAVVEVVSIAPGAKG